MPRLNHFFFTAVLAGVAGVSQAGLVVDFNAGPADLTGNFAGNGQSLPNHNATIGVGGGGGLALPFNTNVQGVQQTGTSEPFNTTGAQVVVSAFFRIDAAPTNNPADARLLDLYAVEATTTNVSAAGAGHAHAGVRLNTVTNNTTYRLQTRNNNASGSNLDIPIVADTFSLILGDWYKLTVTLTNLDAGLGTIEISAAIDHFGTSGTSFVSNLFTGATANVTNTVIAADSSVFGAFRMPRGDNLSAMDNFSFGPVPPIPEPATIGLLALGAAVAVLRRRR